MTMCGRKRVIYYLTEDLHNEKEHNEIHSLQQLAPVVIVTSGIRRKNTLGVKQILLKPRPHWQQRAQTLWARICFLCGRLADSQTDYQFPRRNIYITSRRARGLVNVLWAVKTLKWFNASLPSYDAWYFAPLSIVRFFRSRHRRSARFQRIVVHDALLVRLHSFAPLVAEARANQVVTLANVKSWDNPFYSQLATRADGYLVWSESMWHDIRRVHGLRRRFFCSWGARPFFSLLDALASESTTVRVALEPGQLVLGYAAAFSDDLMGRHEIELIKGLAHHLAHALPRCQVLFRPYPTLLQSFYAPLVECPNVRIVGIEGAAVDRFADGRELIRFGSDQERLHYLAQCDAFLSLATSFTIEAAICGLPLIHFYLPEAQRSTLAEQEIFGRVDISDHLLEYYVRELSTASSYAELVAQLQALLRTAPILKSRGDALLARMGVPQTTQQRLHLQQALRREFDKLTHVTS